MKLDPERIGALEQIARGAGEQILTVYDSDDFDIEAKRDGSPLTRADRLAHEYIVAGLSKLTPNVPVLHSRSHARMYDPG